MSDSRFFAELRRRNVYKVAAAYAVVSWLLIQIATQVFPFFEIPNWSVRLVVVVLILGFPVALIFSWMFEITPEGIKRESKAEPGKSRSEKAGRKIVAATVGLGLIAAAMLTLQTLRPKEATNSRTKPQTAMPDIPAKSIAVLPFANLSSNKENAYFVEGI
jgi:hypothetical protein